MVVQQWCVCVCYTNRDPGPTQCTVIIAGGFSQQQARVAESRATDNARYLRPSTFYSPACTVCTGLALVWNCLSARVLLNSKCSTHSLLVVISSELIYQYIHHTVHSDNILQLN